MSTELDDAAVMVAQTTVAPGEAYYIVLRRAQTQAHRRVRSEVEAGRLPRPGERPCADCGHTGADRIHEYDHYLGYAPAHQLDVEAVCKQCHEARGRARRAIIAAAGGTPEPARVAEHLEALQAVSSPEDVAAAIAFRLDPLLDTARDEVDVAREHLELAEQRVGRLLELAAAAQAIVLGVPLEGGVVLRGRAVADKAIAVALDHGRRELHYTEWFDLLRRDGYLVAGDKPLDTFLTNLTRHPRVESAGARSGVYRITGEPLMAG